MKTENGTNVNILRQAMLISVRRRAWTNRAKATNEKIKTEEMDATTGQTVSGKVPDQLNVTKQLVVCKEYKDITDYLNKTYEWVLQRSMLATGIGRGINFAKREMIGEIAIEIDGRREHLLTVLVPRFLEKYAESKEKAKLPVSEGGLGPLYNEADYPSESELRKSFDIVYRVFALSVPDELPEEIREKENAKLKAAFQQAQDECVYALREGLQGLVSHAIDRLRVSPGEKPKVFVADSLVGNFNEFFDTFRYKNLMNDAELESVVNKAKEVVAQFAPNIQNIKKSNGQRNLIAAKLSEVKTTLDGLLKDRPARKFDFSE